MLDPAPEDSAAPPELPAAVLERARRGDRAAQRELVVCYQGLIFGYLSRMLASRGRDPRVEDLAQDTFVRVFRALPRFRPGGPARLSSWILTIATRLAIDELRRHRNRSVALETVPLVADERPDRRVLTRAVYRAVAELDPEMRAALLLRELCGLTVAETAEALGCEPGTVKSRVSRAKRKLRAALGETP